MFQSHNAITLEVVSLVHPHVKCVSLYSEVHKFSKNLEATFKFYGPDDCNEAGSIPRTQICYFLTFCWPCIPVYLSQYLTNLMHKILFHNKFYFMPLHVSSICAHHQKVKIAFHSLWYHHTYKWPDDEHIYSKHVEAWNKTYCETKLCASSWLNTEINHNY